MTQHFPTIASANASQARSPNQIWIVVEETRDGTRFHHFFSEDARDEFARSWCKSKWSDDLGCMPTDWLDAYETLSLWLRLDFLHCSEPIDLGTVPQPSAPALNCRQQATVLAALRLWQRVAMYVEGLPETGIATNAGAHSPLTMAEINQVCRQFGGIQ